MEEEFRKPWSFYRSAHSSKLEDANLYRKIGPFQAHSGPADTVTSSEQYLRGSNMMASRAAVRERMSVSKKVRGVCESVCLGG